MTTNKKKIIIAAIGTQNGEIGISNRVPWSIPEELSLFKKNTLGSCVIMGSKTYISIGKPLPGRENIVISNRLKTVGQASGEVIFADGLPQAIKCTSSMNCDKIFIIGGEQVYKDAIQIVDEMWISRVEYTGAADTFFPTIDPNIWTPELVSIHTSGEINWSFWKYKKE